MRKQIHFVFLSYIILVTFLSIDFQFSQNNTDAIHLNTANPELNPNADINITKLSNWDGFFGFANCIDLNGNIAFLGGAFGYGVIIVDTSFFSLPSPKKCLLIYLH